MSSDANIPMDSNHEDRYLWDGAGPVDADVAAMEQAGAGARAVIRWQDVAARRMRRRAIRVAALVLVMSFMGVGGYLGYHAQRASQAPWTGFVAQIEGDATVRAGSSGEFGGECVRITAPIAGTVRVTLANGGIVDLGSRASILVDKAGKSGGRVRLEQGDLRVDAPGMSVLVGMSGGGVVEVTPGSEAVFDRDEVDKRGVVVARSVRVTSGWVEVVGREPRFRLAAGDSCRVMPDGLVRLATREGAPDEFAKAVTLVDDLRMKNALDSGKWKVDPVQRAAELAESDDASTLWNLMRAVAGSQREVVAGRLLMLIGRKDEKLIEQLVSADASATDEVWAEIANRAQERAEKRRGK